MNLFGRIHDGASVEGRKKTRGENIQNNTVYNINSDRLIESFFL